MSGATAYLPSEADQLEKLTDDLTTKEWNDVWDVYESRGYDSAALVAQKYQTAFKTRYKVTGDAIDQAIERLRAAATTAAQTNGDTPIADQIDALAATLAPARPTTKSARPPTMKSLIETAINNWDGR